MREQFRKARKYHKIRLMNLFGNGRIIIVMLLLFIIFREYTKDIRTMCDMTGVSISQYFCTFFLSDYIIATGLMKILILLVYVFVICNVSRPGSEQYYYIIRTGKKAWIVGDILFITFITFVFCIVIYFYSVICFLPNLEFQRGWGKIIGTLAYTDASMQYGSLFVIPARMLELYNPIMATLLSLLLLFLGCMVLGLTIYTANIISMTNIFGLTITSFLILLSPLIVYARLPELYWFSPISWVSVGNLYPIRSVEYPSTAFAVIMLSIISLCYITTLIMYSGKMEVRGDYNG